MGSCPAASHPTKVFNEDIENRELQSSAGCDVRESEQFLKLCPGVPEMLGNSTVTLGAAEVRKTDTKERP